MSISISIIMPALNEEDNILKAIDSTLEAFDSLRIDGEIVVINDGSTDKTGSLVESKMKENSKVRMVVHEKPKGIGASFWDGVDSAKNEAVCMFPGDNENEPEEMLRYCKLLQDTDVIVPFVYNKNVRSLSRNILSVLFRFIINTTFMTNFNYTNGTVMYRRAAINNIEHRSDGFLFQTEILIKAIKKGYLFAEVPCSLGKRESQASKALTFSSLVRVMKSYLWLVWDVYFTFGKKKIAEGSVTYQRYKQSKS